MPTYGSSSKHPTKDATIRSDTATTNYGSGATLLLGYFSSNGAYYRPLLHFDISDIPPLAAITSAKLYLYWNTRAVVGGNPDGLTFNAYRLRRSDWVEGECTWNIYKTSNDWTTAGAADTTNDLDTSVADNITWPNWTGSAAWISIDIPNLVADAIANRSKQLHIRLSGTNSSAPVLDSHEGTNPPYLVIEYTIPVVDTTAATSVGATGATLNGVCTDDAAQSLTNYGFVWKTGDAGADPGNSDPEDGAGDYTYGWHADSGATENVAFNHAITGLSGLTQYRCRAAVYNAASGWTYGDEVTFTTLATHRISNSGTSGIKIGGVAVQNALVIIYDLLEETVAHEHTDSDGKYTHDSYTSGDVIPKLVAVCVYDVKASLTHGTGNAGLVFTAKATDATHWYPGEAGNNLAIVIADDATHPETVAVSGAEITVHMTLNTATASDIKAAIEADTNANKMVSVALVGDGTGFPAALAHTHLSGGKYYTSTAHAFVTPAEIT